jgi:tetratricopeptide (TPR) repeat protein
VDDDAFERTLDEGYALEQALRWPEAERFYDALKGDAALRGDQAAEATLRHANSLMILRRWDEARAELDVALTAAKASGSRLVLARALVGAGVYAASRNDVARGEEFLLGALEAFHEIHDKDGIAGEGWALINLAAIYGRTKRLDLSFLTFEKARERLFKVEDWIGVATAWELQAQLREMLGDADRVGEDYHEAMSFYAKQGMTEKVEEIKAKLGGRRVV